MNLSIASFLSPYIPPICSTILLVSSTSRQSKKYEWYFKSCIDLSTTSLINWINYSILARMHRYSNSTIFLLVHQYFFIFSEKYLHHSKDTNGWLAKGIISELILNTLMLFSILYLITLSSEFKIMFNDFLKGAIICILKSACSHFNVWYT